MKEYRLKPSQLCMADAMPFQQHHEARIAGRDLNDDEILTDLLLIDVRGNIRVGDEVVVCGYSDQTYERLTQFATLRVVALNKDGVRFVRVGEIIAIPITEDEPAPKEVEPKVFAKRGYQCFNVLDKSDNVIESFKTMVEATEYARTVNMED